MDYIANKYGISINDYSLDYVFEYKVMPLLRTLSSDLAIVTARTGSPYFIADYMTNIVKMLSEKANTTNYLKRFPLIALILDNSGSQKTTNNVELFGVYSFEVWIIMESRNDWSTTERELYNFKAILTPLYVNLLTAIKQLQNYFRLGDGDNVEHVATKEYYCTIKENNRINEYADAIRIEVKNLNLLKNYQN